MARPGQISKSVKIGSALVAGAVTAMVVVGVSALAQTDDVAVPRGPFIDFCPTTEQIEAHLVEYGFDYKPTIPCGENGEELQVTESPVDNDAELEDIRKALLTATRAPDEDGDPLTMEVVLEDGSEMTISINGDPCLFEDMTPEEFARGVFPTREDCSK